MSPEITAAIIAAGASILTLTGTVVAQVIGFRSTKANTEQQTKAAQKATADTLRQQREHLDRTLAEQREQLNTTLKAQSDQLDRTLAEQRTRTLNERFATAAGQLGSDKSAVRLAGVYAMAGLADDWEENRQTCVEVLCANLRMPYEPDPGSEVPEPQRLIFQTNREVRHTVIRVITAHLRDNANVSWQGLNFDFTGTVFDGGDFSAAHFSSGVVRFDSAEFSSGTVNFDFARFSGAGVLFRGAKFSGGRVTFKYATLSDGMTRFEFAEFSGAAVDFYGAKFPGGTASFKSAKVSSGSIYFRFAAFSGAKVSFRFAEFSGGKVSFRAARFTGSEFDFDNTEFSGGEIDFSRPGDWSSPPVPWTHTPPPGVKLPYTAG
ncbi:MAG: hypothetical protein ABSA53_36985 [Streptosporangiaceae bacterium]|jgi:uncharacterized protein YjbI with pentapeptide repeats